MQAYLTATEIIDYQNPKIQQLAHQLTNLDKTTTAKACFEWVRDNIYHSCDYQMNPVTCRASDVLEYKTGYCYAKSHLLAALLRANSIPTGFCYQRLSVFDNGTPYSLHGLNAVYLADYGWYRIDARGNKPGINAQFTPPQEQLAFKLNFADEVDCKHVFAEPLPEVIKSLQTSRTWDEALQNLPDVEQKYLVELTTNMRSGIL